MGVARWRLNHLHLTADATLAVDHLPPFGCSHAGEEAEFAGAFDLADLVGVMHGENLSKLEIAWRLTPGLSFLG